MAAAPLKDSTGEATAGSWFESHIEIVVVSVTLLGFFVRLWAASGTFLNPDEALHFRLANQLSLALAYKESLTASHPPLLTFILYFWRKLGTSELWLRLPSVLAGVVFCWMFYRWLSNAAGKLTGMIGLLFVSFLPPVVQLAAEIRQYALLLAFLASALYFLDRAFQQESIANMAEFSICLYLAMLSHYSAFLFAAAVGIYALVKILGERPPVRVILTWSMGQLGALFLAGILYKTHLAKLGVGESRTVLQGWMSEFFLRRSYFDPAQDNPLLFVTGHTFGVFQYVWGQLAVGVVMGLLFFVGVTLLLRGDRQSEDFVAPRSLGIFLLLPFTTAAGASLAHAYPYGGTRHLAFLVIPVAAGVSVALARLAAGKWERAFAVVVFSLTLCLAFGKSRGPKMERADQSRAHMTAAIEFVRQKIAPSDVIFTDYQTELILGHYLCQQRPIAFERAPATFDQFSCDGHRVVSRDYKGWQFWAGNFPEEWRRFVQIYRIKPGTMVWILQAGWNADLPEDLQQHGTELHDPRFESFGNNIKIFALNVGATIQAP